MTGLPAGFHPTLEHSDLREGCIRLIPNDYRNPSKPTGLETPLHKRSLSSLGPDALGLDALGPDALGLDRGDKILLRIMVVDDDEMVRSSTCGLLQTYPDIEVVCEAADGAEAVTKAREYRPDVIVMDITMPTMNGLEATRIIKRDTPGIQIVVVSGQDAHREALSAGASGYVLKTQVADRLVTELRKVQALRPSEVSERDEVSRPVFRSLT